MARSKSEFLSSLGVMFQICKSLVDEVLARGGTDADLRRIQTDEALCCALANLIIEKKDGAETKLTPPPGGHLYTICVPVNPQRGWAEAIDTASPDTPENHSVHKVGKLYPVTTGPIKSTEIILMNFGPNGGNWDKALEWAKTNNLELTTPRQVFAIGEHQPNLHKKLGMDPMYVVATTECTFEGNQRACNVWWNDAEREADLLWVSGFGDACDWFAFVRPPAGEAGQSSGLES